MDSLLVKRIKEFCDGVGISKVLDGAHAVIVGFSGGADSALLLTYFSEYYPGTVAASHLDHLIRGEEAQRDLEFCKGFCDSHGIRFFSEKADVSAIAEKLGESVEECGRDLRYEFFHKCRKELAAELGCEESDVAVATAHNADDNLETVIFNIARGTALRGIGGIPPVRDGYIVRPLLCLSSDEIRRVCAAEGIPYVNDSTNGEVLYTRNRIRHLVVPELKRINPKAADVVLSLARSAASVDEYLTKTAEALIEEHPAAFPRSLFCALDPALASYVVTGLYSKTASEESLSSSHIDSLLKAMREGASGIMHLPGNVSAYYGRTLGFIVEKNKKAEYPFRLDLSFGENPVDKCGFSVGMYRPGEDFGTCGDNIYKELIYKITLNDKIKNSLFIRNRADSDTYYFGGHHRKLKKLLCDTGIPRYRRDRLPVLCDGEGIVWVPGFPQRDGTLPSDEKDAKYVITYSETEGDAGND